MKLKCPTCKKMGDWFAAEYGPFCSHRCKLVDLGKWFGEEHVISRPVQPRDFEAASDEDSRALRPPDQES